MIYDFLDEIADCCSIPLVTLLKKNCKFTSIFFQKLFIRKFGIVDKGIVCDAQGPGFESRQGRNFKVSRLNKRWNHPFFLEAHKSLNCDISTKFFLLNFITQWYLKNRNISKLIDFLINYPTIQYQSTGLR